MIAWDDRAARETLVSALVNDAGVVLEAFAGADLDDKGAAALALLALVAGQDVEPAEGSDGTNGRWRIARGVAADRMISTVDPDSRHVHKTQHRRQDGYKAHVAIEPDTGLFTSGRVTKATGEDNHAAVVGLELLAGEDRGLRVLGDSAGQARVDLAASGHTAVIKPGPLRPAVAGGFTIDDFTADEQAGTVTCPNGVTRHITRARRVTFGAACRACPLRSKCTTRANGRILNLHEHDAIFITATPAARPTPVRKRSPFPDEVARALAEEASLGRLAEVHDPSDFGLRDIWETIIVTRRRVSEVLQLRLDCTGRPRSGIRTSPEAGWK